MAVDKRLDLTNVVVDEPGDPNGIGLIDMNGNVLPNLADPIDGQDGTTKSYVDARLVLIETLKNTSDQSLPIGVTILPVDIVDAPIDNDFFSSSGGSSLTSVFFKKNGVYLITGQVPMTRGNNSAGSLKGGVGIFYSEQSPIFLQTAPCQFNAGDPVDTLQVAYFHTQLIVNNANPSNILALDAFQTTAATAANTLTLPLITYPAVSGGNNGSVELKIYTVNVP